MFSLINTISTLADDSRPEQIIELPFRWAVRLLADRMAINGIFLTTEIFRLVKLIVLENVVSWPPTWNDLILCGICCRGNFILHIIRSALVLQFTSSDSPGHAYSIPVGSRLTDGVAGNITVILNIYDGVYNRNLAIHSLPWLPHVQKLRTKDSEQNLFICVNISS